ncbi:MAG: hypothetical protein ACREQW_01485, partial [Candidatus Binatia bacterium]
FEIFVEGGVLGKGAFLPGGEDPDSFVRAHGKDGLEAVLSRALPLADYFVEWLGTQYGKSLQGRSQIAQEVSRVLVKVRNPFEADLLARRASDALGIREELLRLPAQGVRVHGRPVDSRAGPRIAAGAVAADLAERSLLGLILRFSRIAEQAAAEQDLENLMAEKWKDAMARALTLWKTRGAIDMASLMQQLTPEVAAQVSGVFLEAEKIEEAEAEKMMSDCLAHLRRRHLKSLQSEARRAIRVAEENQDENVRKERILEWQEIARRKNQLERREL